MLKIDTLDKNSIAESIGLRPDDVILSFDGQVAIDMLDVTYYDSVENFKLVVLRNGKRVSLSVHKDADTPMGWNFYDDSYLEPRNCINKCSFCFVDQLPEGLRDTLYVKDDDWRLSFVSGNYVTLTNVSERELARMCRRKYSPMYISVHATDDSVRRTLLGNNLSQEILPLLRRLADAGITMHTQVVLVGGYNDGVVLQRTMEDLFALYPKVASLAVVPVGLTRFRNGLDDIKPIDMDVARSTVKQIESFAQKAYASCGERFVYSSDEMYIKANLPLPPYDYYGDFPQIENGVGLIADLNYQFDLALQDAVSVRNQTFSIVTGIDAAPYMQSVLDKAKRKFPNLRANVIAVKNKFFGESVTVAGLLVGKDIVDTVKSRNDIGEVLLLPRVMLREIENVFLDGMTLEQFKCAVCKEVVICADGYETCQALLVAE
ncbi:MAG: DUF512 domain-containing protein [Corallococcus sp.]|nr:DUF512 domain-containing protein [Corallococcus sp.]